MSERLTTTGRPAAHLLVYEQFKAWVCAQPARRRFARRDAEACPLACYLNETQDGEWAIWKGTARRKNQHESFVPPAWTDDFMDQVDGVGTRFLIEARTACKIISEIAGDKDEMASEEEVTP